VEDDAKILGSSLLIGLFGTVLGIGAGLLLNRWTIASTIERTMPDMSMDVVVSASTVLTALALSVIAVGVAPLLTSRAPSHGHPGNAARGRIARRPGHDARPAFAQREDAGDSRSDTYVSLRTA
jgi:hypothetical protein